jgi:hypothetical protein
MMRGIVVAVGAAVLSFLLESFAGYLSATSPDMQQILDVSADARAGKPVTDSQGATFWATLERGYFRSVWICHPAVSLIVGVIVGLLVRQRAWLVAVVGMLPSALAFSVGTHGVASGLPFLCLYLAIAAAAAQAAESLWVRPREAR